MNYSVIRAINVYSLKKVHPADPARAHIVGKQSSNFQTDEYCQLAMSNLSIVEE